MSKNRLRIKNALRKIGTVIFRDAINKYGTEIDSLIDEYGAGIKDGKIVYSLEYKKSKREAEDFAEFLRRALKASTVSVMPYTDNSMVSIEIK